MASSGRRIQVIAALVAVLVLLPGSTGAAAASKAPVVAASVSSTTTGQPMPSGFLGASLEYRALHVYTGRDPAAVNPVLVALLRGLVPGRRPVLRIGGDSADYTWWPMRGAVAPGGVTYRLTPGWLQMARALAVATRARLIMGVNLAAGRPALGAAEARALLQGVGRGNIAALEIGNEADLYGAIPWYYDRHGHAVFARARNYSFASFIQDFSRWSAALPTYPLAGPSFAQLNWLSGLDQFLSTAKELKFFTLHRYPLRACLQDTTSPAYASIPNLLSDQAASGLAQGVAPYVSQVHARGLPARVDEMNSASCSGKRGVSDTFASALWALDAVFNLAKAGVDGVNFHSLPHAAYELFTFRHRRTGWQAFVHPEYYGLLLFAQAFPPGARLLDVTAPEGAVKVWATAAPDGHTRVVLINKDTANPADVQVQVPGAGTATLDWLQAPSATAMSGVTLGARTFGSATSTGTLPSPQHTQPISATAGAYTVTLPAASAVLLTQ